jgi:hypothetical protein
MTRFRDGKVQEFKETMQKYLESLVLAQREVRTIDKDGQCLENLLRRLASIKLAALFSDWNKVTLA